jgi:virginiamycin A acetyltransferase
MYGPNNGPNPGIKHPIPMHTRVGFLKPLVTAENIEVGDFTYYDDPDGPDLFQTKCVLHHYPFIGDRLIIGKFCAIAEGARFIMNGANHAMSGFSTYPFNIFGHGWEEGFDPETWHRELRGDTVVGNDVWIGMEALILPGMSIGHGAIAAAKAVVTHDVPPYAIVAGNPAKVVKMRFDQRTVDRLLKIAWWDWPVDKIGRNLNAIRGADIAALEAAA